MAENLYVTYLLGTFFKLLLKSDSVHYLFLASNFFFYLSTYQICDNSLLESVLRSRFSFLLMTSWKHETCLPEISTMMHHTWIYWCTERGSYPFTQYPTKIFNHAIIRSPLMNTLMSFSLHCSRAGIFKRYHIEDMGMSDSYWLNPPFMWTVHTPGIYPGCSYPQFLRSRFPSEMREASGHHSYSLSSHQSRDQQKTPLMLPLCTRTFTWLISESFI